MKKGLLALFCLFLAFCMSGCSYVKLTEQETNQIAEYMAGKLLEYDRYYDEALIKEDDLTKDEDLASDEKTPEESQAPIETPEPSKEPDKTASTEDNEDTEPEISSDLNTVFNQKGVSLTYKGCKKCSSYPEDSKEQYFVVEAGLGKQLMVLEFNIKNTASSDVELSLLDSTLKYQLVLDDGSTVSPLKSWLTDDLQFIEGKISEGRSIASHLVFEVDSGVKADKAVLEIYEGENSARVPLK